MAEDLAHSPAWLIVVAVCVLVEMAWRLAARRGYDGGQALTTLGLVAGNIPAALLQALVVGAAFALTWRLAPVHLPLQNPWTWIAGFVVVEFAYYWFHRASHRMRWLWASHAVHHSAEEMTLLSSLRLGWTNLLSGGWIVYLPVIAMGFDPRMVAALLAFDLHYQFFLHTEAPVSLGPLEWLFNSPSHHRVHHGANDWCLDRNYGGVLIVFDRVFGTFAGERRNEVIRYGLVNRAREANPLKLVLREWRQLMVALRRARNIRTALAIAFAPPG